VCRSHRVGVSGVACSRQPSCCVFCETVGPTTFTSRAWATSDTGLARASVYLSDWTLEDNRNLAAYCFLEIIYISILLLNITHTHRKNLVYYYLLHHKNPIKNKLDATEHKIQTFED
jgi:hypothetical protein